MKPVNASRGTLPFLMAAFLNAFLDLGHKIVIQNTIFKVYDDSAQVILTAILNGLILLPFILLFSPAGFTSDRFPKNKVMRMSAWATIFLTVAITLSYAAGMFWLAFAMTFLLAVQSAFYSPAKFGYIRGFFGKQHLAEANGFVSAVTITAILAGTFIFSILFEIWIPEAPHTKSEILHSLVPIGLIFIIISIIELALLYRIPEVDEGDSNKTFNTKDYLTGKSIKENIQPIIHNRAIKLSIIGLSMFWSVSQVLVASFPDFMETRTGINNAITLQSTVAISGIGIILGSLIASRISRNYIETGLIPVGALGIAIGLWILPNLHSIFWMRMDFLFIGTMAGMFIVPLNSLIQFYAPEKDLGKVLAGNNLVQNISMLTFLLVTIVFSTIGLTSQHLLFFIAAIAVIGGVYTVRKLPQSLVRVILAFFVKKRYKVKVQGMKNIPANGGVLLLGNHISFIDWAILQIASPRQIHFVMLKSIYSRWYLKWFFDLFGCIPIESGPTSKKSLETVTNLLNEGHAVCLFPEGALSRTGHLAEFRRGYEKAAQEANDDVKVLPFYLRGLWGSKFSHSPEDLRPNKDEKWHRDIIVAFGEPIDKLTTADVLKRKIFDLSISSWQKYVNTLASIPETWIDTVKKQKSSIALSDTLVDPLTAEKALTGAVVISKKIQKLSPEKNIGILLPMSAGGMLTNMAGLLAGKTVVNLNYTASQVALEKAIASADIKTIYTSKRFIKKLEDRGIDLSSILENLNVIIMEELRESMSNVNRIFTFLSVKLFPAYLLKKLYCKKQSVEDTAAILFSSGSEGTPKGIMLSHKNILANLKQIANVLNAQNNEVIMASLPLFHAFGLTVTQFLPLLEGIPVVCHADPTDALGIGKAVAKYNATIMFGTSTFFRIYCRNNKLDPLMFESLRLVIAGAEKLNPEVRDAFKMKFNKTILEGYGATETTPVASVNLPNALDTNSWKIQLGGKIGTVGMPLPGTSFKIVDPNTLEELTTGESGMILIGGAQVMQGYLHDQSKTDGVIHVINDTRWYITGDKGYLDTDGFLTIVDRYSRFAKLGGEMVSLSSVEAAVGSALHDAYPDIDVIAVNLPDDKKGEKIVLLCEQPLSLDEIKEKMLQAKCNGMMIPSAVIQVENLPKLGSGKTDFALAKQVALNTIND